jgi:HPt (histidine-containing phosphotransfer) domain-containing protein
LKKGEKNHHIYILSPGNRDLNVKLLILDSFKPISVEKIIDLTYIEEVAAGDREFIHEMIETFMRQVPEFVTHMQEFYVERDYKLLAKEAHTAKSSVMLFGLDDLARKLKEFQLQAEKGEHPETYVAFIREFEQTCLTAISQLEEELQK